MRRFATAILLAATQTAQTAEAATRAAVTRVRTVQPITITVTRDLDFGRIVRGPTAGTVTVNPRTDARTRTGGTTLVGGGTPGAARFVVNGTASRPVQVTLGPLPTLTRVSGGGSMAMNTLTMNGGINRTLTAAGTLDLRVGGRLVVAANQLDGLYTGTFTVTVDYR
jgi:Mat/Ecp fimbriae major subunit